MKARTVEEAAESIVLYKVFRLVSLSSWYCVVTDKKKQEWLQGTAASEIRFSRGSFFLLLTCLAEGRSVPDTAETPSE